MRCWAVVPFFLFALILSSCTDQKSPLAPTAVAPPALPLVPPPLPTAVPGVLAVAMPIDASDLANVAFGLTPFGYHGADHALDGHSGWDIEYRIGGTVRAAAAGTVDDVFPDAITPGRFTVQLEHLVGAHFYRTIYTNLASVNPDIAVREAVRLGQALGTAGTSSTLIDIPGTLGTSGIVSFGMTHFQLDDLEFHREGPDPKAVSPEPFLTAEGKSLFDRIWSSAAFMQELVEPFATNPRTLRFPVSRTWIRAGGDGPAGIRFIRRTAAAPGYEYELLAESGTVIETGTVALRVTARPYPFIDLVSPTAGHVGIYDIVSNEMRLLLTTTGTQRPLDLSGASV
ncbi:MAG TPA: M23 family metallopeptidase, partial [Vicinamibacterales bacterium]|nr:M23 family metallopeptidase [Vicinamibacterales bacterium]